MPPEPVEAVPTVDDDENVRFWTHVPFEDTFSEPTAVHDTIFDTADGLEYDDLDRTGSAVRI